jgi:diguanylate cyclase (GGDEF)-like protein
MDHVFAPDDCWALRKSKPHYEGADGDHVICPNFAHCVGKRYLCVPMMAYGEVIGNLHLGLRADEVSAEDRVDDELRQLALMASDQIALALANLKLRATLQYQSHRDPLTHLYNRRYLLEALEREIARSARSKKPVSLLVIDIDHFKRYNDTYGHDAGDQVLREFGAVLKQAIRESDIACRHGGEEFVITLPESSSADAYLRANELRKKVASLMLEHRGQRLGQITVSVGVAAYPEHGSTTDELLAAADVALYRAKAHGRNCVIMAEPAGGAAACRGDAGSGPAPAPPRSA